jgi:ABC-2 type transport system permease protein
VSSQTTGYRQDLGRPIAGPSALTDDWSRFWHLVYNIARNEFKLKFYGSVLGYLWQVVRPLMLFGVLYIFFVVIIHVGRGGTAGEHHYGAQLLGSIVLFTFFSEATTGAVRSVVDRENLVRKIQFPRLAIPLSVALLAFFNLILNLVVVLVLSLAEGVEPAWTWLMLPLLLLLLVVFSSGIAMLLSALFVSFRDVQPIWDVLGQVLFYASPVIIPVENVHKRLGEIGAPWLMHIYMLNPLAVIFQEFRHAMVNPASVSASAAAGGWLPLLAPLAIVFALLALGFYVFNRSAPRIAENL